MIFLRSAVLAVCAFTVLASCTKSFQGPENKTFANGGGYGGTDQVVSALDSASRSAQAALRALAERTESGSPCRRDGCSATKEVCDLFQTIPVEQMTRVEGELLTPAKLNQLADILAATPIRVTDEPLLAENQIVDARTALGPNGPIEFNRSRNASKTPERLAVALIHEAYHKLVPAYNDLDAIGTVAPGKNAIDAAAACAYTWHQESVIEESIQQEEPSTTCDTPLASASLIIPSSPANLHETFVLVRCGATVSLRQFLRFSNESTMRQIGEFSSYLAGRNLAPTVAAAYSLPSGKLVMNVYLVTADTHHLLELQFQDPPSRWSGPTDLTNLAGGSASVVGVPYFEPSRFVVPVTLPDLSAGKYTWAGNWSFTR